MKAQTFANVWDALEDSPEDAATTTMRSNVMAIINATVGVGTRHRCRLRAALALRSPDSTTS
jgi:predicted XRE-type DNA-binding protein